MSQTSTETVQMLGIEEVKQQDSLDQMELIARKSLALHLKSLGIDFTSTALDEIYHLFNMYLDSTLTDLSKIVQVQRRFKASPKDLKILFEEHDISMNELNDEILRMKKIPNDLINKQSNLIETAKNLSLTTIQNQELMNNGQFFVDSNDPSYVFFAHNQDLSDLVPSSHKRGKTIPNWLPQFPPDHTYLKTPNYTNRITDQKVVRTKIAEESKFGEQALDHLLSFETKKDKVVNNLEENLSKDEIAKLTEEEKKLLWTPGLEKKLDIEKYAKIRLKYNEQKKQLKEFKETKLNHNYYQLINELSSYTKSDKYDSNLKITPQDYIENQFNVAFKSLASLKTKKAEREVERVKLQKEENIRIAKLKEEQKLKALQEQKEKQLEKENKEIDDELIDEEAKLFNDFDNFDNFNFDNFGSPNNETSNNVLSFNAADKENNNNDGNESGSDELEIFEDESNENEVELIKSIEEESKDISGEVNGDVEMINFDEIGDDEDMFDEFEEVDTALQDTNIETSQTAIQFSEFDTAIENESMMPNSEA